MLHVKRKLKKKMRRLIEMKELKQDHLISEYGTTDMSAIMKMEGF